MKMNNFKMDLVLSTVQSDQTPIYLNSSRVPYLYKKESKLVDIDKELERIKNLISEIMSRKDLDFASSGEFMAVIDSISKVYNNFDVKVYKSVRDIFNEYGIQLSGDFIFNEKLLSSQDFKLKPTINSNSSFTSAYNRIALSKDRINTMFRMLSTFRIYVNVGSKEDPEYRPTPLAVHFSLKA